MAPDQEEMGSAATAAGTPAAGPAGPAVAEDAAPRRKRRLPRYVWLLIALGIIVFAGLAVDAVTASPALCGSCHEMLARMDEWRQSPHTKVACVTCHQPLTASWNVPMRLVDRARLFMRDAAAHDATGHPDPVDVRGASTPPIADAICLQCHDPNRRPTSGLRITIDHPKHAKLNGSCVSCHIRAAHPLPTRGAALSLMTQCFTCHGRGPDAKAPNRCGLCHPEGYRMRPSFHDTAKWKAGGHGALAMADIRMCEMCHAKSMCDGCHGIDMPHPMGWSETGHIAPAKANPDLCAVCHGPGLDGPDCSKCHAKK